MICYLKAACQEKNEMQTMTNESNFTTDEWRNYKNTRKEGARLNNLENSFLTRYCKAKGKRN